MFGQRGLLFALNRVDDELLWFLVLLNVRVDLRNAQLNAGQLRHVLLGAHQTAAEDQLLQLFAVSFSS